jgi:hypothetical protein
VGQKKRDYRGSEEKVKLRACLVRPLATLAVLAGRTLAYLPVPFRRWTA